MDQVVKQLGDRGFTLGYALSLSFLNVALSPIFCVIYVALYFFTGQWALWAFSAGVAFAATFVIQHFAYGPRQPVPSNSAILITGCSTGIGYETALNLANLGFTVFATVRKDSDFDKLRAAAADGKTKERLVKVILDVTKPDQLAAAVVLVGDVLSKRGLHLQSVINNAGYSEAGMLEVAPESAIRAQYDANVIGPVSVTNAFLPLLRKAKPAIAPSVVFVTSVVASVSVAGMAIYCSSKHALHALADGYRQELRPWGINVIEVAPGSVITAFLATALDSYKSNSVSTDNGASSSGAAAAAASSAAPGGAGAQRVVDKAVADVYMRAGESILADGQRMASLGSSPSVVSEILAEAVLSSRPQSLYRAGKDAQLFIPLIRMVPWVADLSSLKHFKL